MKCDRCDNYVHHYPTWNDPSEDEYCKVYGDFCNMEYNNVECNQFKLSKYGQKKSNIDRIKKFERILK